jgi:YD repeat-containing protein
MLTDKPWLLTHVVEEGEGGRAMRLTYDKTDQLISMEVGDRLYAVVTTNTGTPTILLESGMIPP